MSMARLVITAVTIEGRSKSEVAREYGVSRVWVQKLIHRFEADGVALRTPVPPPSFQPVRGRSGGGGPDRAAA